MIEHKQKNDSGSKMGDSDSGVGVMPGVDSVFCQFGVGVGTGVKYFYSNLLLVEAFLLNSMLFASRSHNSDTE